MASLNQCSFIGNLGADPEIRYMPNGEAVASFSIACTENYKDANGVRQEKTEWVRLVFFRKLAEICGEYLVKGAQVYVSGRLHTRSYEKDGKKLYTTEVVGETMKMLGKKESGDQQDQAPSRAHSARQSEQGMSKAVNKSAEKGQTGSFDDFEDDIPF